MVIKSKAATATPKARSRRKSRINTKLITNIVHFPAERRKEAAQAKWDTSLKVYLSSLSGWELDVAKHILMFIKQSPSLVDRTYSCKVIPFSSKQQQVGG